MKYLFIEKLINDHAHTLDTQTPHLSNKYKQSDELRCSILPIPHTLHIIFRLFFALLAQPIRLPPFQEDPSLTGTHEIILLFQ